MLNSLWVYVTATRFSMHVHFWVSSYHTTDTSLLYNLRVPETPDLIVANA